MTAHPTTFPYDNEGEQVHRGRLRVTGSATVQTPIRRGETVAVVMVGPVVSIAHKPFEDVLSRMHSLSSEEVYVVDLEDVEDVLTFARIRQEEAEGVQRIPAIEDEPVETETCPACNGEKSVKTLSDDGLYEDWTPCQGCDGTGVVPKAPVDQQTIDGLNRDELETRDENGDRDFDRVGLGKPDLDAAEQAIRDRAASDGEEPTGDGLEPDPTDEHADQGAVEVLEDVEQLSADDLARLTAQMTAPRLEGLKVVGAHSGVDRPGRRGDGVRISNKTHHEGATIYWQVGNWLIEQELIDAQQDGSCLITSEGRQVLAHLAADEVNRQAAEPPTGAPF